MKKPLGMLSILFFLITSCSTTVPVDTSDVSDSKGNYRIYTEDKGMYNTNEINWRNDSLVVNRNKAISKWDIKKIEKDKFDPLKTIGLLAVLGGGLPLLLLLTWDWEGFGLP